MNTPHTTTTTFTGAHNHGFQLGQNTGSISNVFNVTPPAASAPAPPRPRPSSTVPFYRDHDFVTRHEFDQLCGRRNDQACRIALVGLGGVGKSQLAIEYAYQVRNEQPETWVFWVHASSGARLEEGFQKIAERTQAPGWDGVRVNILEVVSRWLENEENGLWVLIIDNADDLDVVDGPWRSRREQGGTSGVVDTRSLLDYLPRAAHGLILVTTRSREVAFRVTESHRDVVDVKPMDDTTGIALLQKKLIIQASEEDATSLIRSLDCMPLAITQAAAFINQRQPRMTAVKYLRDLHQGDEERTRLLERDIKDPRRDEESSNAIMTTWYISFEHLRRSRPSAARLFALMSCFDREAIPEELIYDYHGPNGGEYGSDREEHDFEDDMDVLRSYCLIGVNVDTGTFEMHRLIQLSTKKWLEMHQELQWWQGRHTLIMARAFPTGEYENWGRCKMLFPHAEVVLPYRVEGMACLEAWATVLHYASWYADKQGWHDKAEVMAWAGLQASKQVQSEEHPDTLNSMGNLASIYRHQGRWREAETLEVKVLETEKRVLGEEHPDTLTSMVHLASTYRYQGRWIEAETLEEKVLETRKRVSGEEHPDTLTTMANLASTYVNQGRWKKSETLREKVLEIRKRVLGEEHPDTLTTVSNLASTYRDQGRWSEAQMLEEKVLETSKRVLGEEHPATLSSMAHLASTYRNQGRWSEAETLEEKVLETRKRVLGEEHPHTLSSMANLAATYLDQGRWSEAETLEEKVLETSKRVLGEEHPDTLISVGNLAVIYGNQGRRKEAETLEEKVLETSKRVLGKEHPDTLSSMNNLAITYRNQGRKQEALALMSCCAHLRGTVLGPKHPNTITSVSTLESWQDSQSLVTQSPSSTRGSRSSKRLKRSRSTYVSA